MITEIEGNLIDMARAGNFWGIAHGCNCQKNWGAGIAKQMKVFSNIAYHADMNNPNPTMGEYSVAKSEYCMVFNLYTQYYPGNNHWGVDSNENRYKAIGNAFRLLNEKYPGKHIGIPLIGVGLAGLKWNKVRKIIDQNAKDLEITIVKLK